MTIVYTTDIYNTQYIYISIFIHLYGYSLDLRDHNKNRQSTLHTQNFKINSALL